MKMYGSYTELVIKHFKNPHNYGKMKNPSGIGKVGNLVCLLPHTMVQCNDSLNSIEDIKINEKVLSHDGKYHKVIKQFKRGYKGIITKIENRLGTNFLTPGHEVLAIKVPKTHHFLYLRNKIKLKPSWYHVEEVEKNDIILYPILKETFDVRSIPVKLDKLKFDHRSKPVPRNIELSDDFLKLCGYFLAEGHSKEEVTNTFISFTFGIKEENYVNDTIEIIRKIFNLEAKKKIIKNHNTIVVTLSNVFVARLFRSLFGDSAENKSLPSFMMFLPPEKQKNIIIGLWSGDGYVAMTRKWPRAGYSTISYKLAQQIKTLLLRQGIIPSLYTEEEKIVKNVKHRKCYRLHIGNRDSLKKLLKILEIKLDIKSEERNDSWCDENYVYVPVNKISKEFYNGFVFNLGVEDSNTFVSDSLTLHNCGDVMWLYIKVEKNKTGKEIIKDIKFETFGCVAALATSSVITDLAKGKTIEEAMKINREDVVKSLGGLPPIKLHCSVLASDALSESIYDYFSRNKRSISKELKEKHERIDREKKEIEKRYKDWMEIEEKMHRGEYK